jgi:hypothetical protein
MSRTYNTQPREVQKKSREHWRFVSGYPEAIGGAWPNRTMWARIRNRKFRRFATVAVLKNHEIIQPKRAVAYDVW